jgi:hypothetical protein
MFDNLLDEEIYIKSLSLIPTEHDEKLKKIFDSLKGHNKGENTEPLTMLC